MAKRENQGLQIAVILLTMSTLLFLILSVIFWNSAKKQFAQAETAKKDAAAANSSASKSQEENQELKKWLGYKEDSNQESMRAEIEKLLATLGSNFTAEQRNFKELPAFLTKTLQAQHAALTTAADSDKKLRGELEAALAREKEHVAQIDASFGKEKDDYLKIREQWEADAKKRREEADKALADSRKTQESLAKKNAELDNEIKGLKGELAALGEKTDLMNLQISQYEKESFDRPSGKVTWVNQALRTVYVSLGSEDALRPQATFSVFDSDTNNLARVEKKGSLEVTRILGEHLAEAQILDDRVTNPIVAGDVIYSPIFQKGKAVHFALAGLVDVDGDHQDDRELVRNLIAISGGVIDAEVTPDGKRTGNITIDTRYLVVGQLPTVGNVSAAQSAMKKIQAECDVAGVAQISLDRFLSDVGYQHATRAVGLGPNARAADFRLDRTNEKRFQLSPAKQGVTPKKTPLTTGNPRAVKISP